MNRRIYFSIIAIMNIILLLTWLLLPVYLFWISGIVFVFYTWFVLYYGKLLNKISYKRRKGNEDGISNDKGNGIA